MAICVRFSGDGSKLAASGQELGGEAIFDVRIGFSGTPNDLVPAELGVCVYEKATDGRINRVLADSDVVSKYLVQPGWTPKKLLEIIATSDEFLALIDCGALVTGLSNREVAEYLIERNSDSSTETTIITDVVSQSKDRFDEFEKTET